MRFIDDVEGFMTTNELTTEVLIGAFTELHQKYKMMEQQLVRQKASLKAKIPDIENTLDLVTILKEKQDEEEEMTVNYPLCDTVHARANVNTNGTVCLWLGANVMVEYSYEEALEMLEKNLTSSRAKLQETSEDQDHLKDQSITLEVVMARVFNHNVKARRLEKVGQGCGCGSAVLVGRGRGPGGRSRSWIRVSWLRLVPL